MWSGPRNLSTAMMRSFGARADCSVMDEPFFAPFLAETGKEHPGRDETLQHHETNPDKVAAMCASPADQTRYSFQKHMPHHMLDSFSLSWTEKAKHFFLLREPERVIASYVKGRSEFEIEDLGFAPQRRLFERLTKTLGHCPPVIHSHDILKAPERALRALCNALNMPFDSTMLSWPAGPRAEDGAWAPYWYASVQNSTGFGAAPTDMPVLTESHKVIAMQCRDDYEALAQHAVVII